MLFSFRCPKNVLKTLFFVNSQLSELDQFLTLSDLRGGRGNALTPAFVVTTLSHKNQIGKYATDRTMDFWVALSEKYFARNSLSSMLTS